VLPLPPRPWRHLNLSFTIMMTRALGVYAPINLASDLQPQKSS